MPDEKKEPKKAEKKVEVEDLEANKKIKGGYLNVDLKIQEAGYDESQGISGMAS